MTEKQQTMKGIDTPIAKACDAYLDLTGQVEGLKNQQLEIQQRIIEHLKAGGRRSVIHQGYRFCVKDIEAKTLLSVKEAPAAE